eukprot:GHVN01094166.1.p1 GENE.GHVN01094166.1~~GHVN01094166.1.p1  ORF type:complete len:245 (-),score=30.56 GHVN01094166.1:231-965(-)
MQRVGETPYKVISVGCRLFHGNLREGWRVALEGCDWVTPLTTHLRVRSFVNANPSIISQSNVFGNKEIRSTSNYIFMVRPTTMYQILGDSKSENNSKSVPIPESSPDGEAIGVSDHGPPSSLASVPVSNLPVENVNRLKWKGEANVVRTRVETLTEEAQREMMVRSDIPVPRGWSEGGGYAGLVVTILPVKGSVLSVPVWRGQATISAMIDHSARAALRHVMASELSALSELSQLSAACATRES